MRSEVFQSTKVFEYFTSRDPHALVHDVGMQCNDEFNDL